MPDPETMGWGIIGCGRVADRRVAPVFTKTDDAALVAFCSRDLSKARSFCDRHGARRAYDSLDGMLADDEVRAVYVATPNALHAEQTCRCLAAGKHVLVDKPMATSPEAAATMMEAARRSGQLLGVMHQQRFHPANMHLIRLRDQGDLGKLNMLRVHIGMWYSPVESWRATPDLSGGGVAMDLAPHALDLMLEVGGDVRRVDALTRNLQFSCPVEDFCTARLEFAGGAVGLMDLGYCAHQYGGRVEAYGSEATFAAEGSMQQTDVYFTWFRRGDTPEPVRQEICVTDCYQEAIEDFTDAVRHDGDLSISMADGLKVMRVIESIYASAESGRPVDVKPA